MGPYLLLIVLVIYLGVALDYAFEKRWGMVIVFIAYALANLGLMVDWGKR